MDISIPDGHGPWCGCAVCRACTSSLSPSTRYEIAAALYKAELAKTQYKSERELERSIASRRELELLWVANSELTARLADIERMYLGYEMMRYAPPSQMRTVREVECRTLEPRERRSPAFTLAIVGMLIALAFISQILLYFH